MPRTIRVDDEVWERLQRYARPFEDSPNTVLRKVLKLDVNSRAVQHKRRERYSTDKLTPSINAGTFRLQFASGDHKDFKLPEKKIGPHIKTLYANVYEFIRKAGGTEGQCAGIRYFLHQSGYYVNGPRS